MKTIAKTLFAVILLMVSLFSFSASGKEPVTIGTGFITYRVNIHVTTEIPMIGHYFFVAITNEQGRLVAPVQIFNPNKMVYTFSEAGPVTGTRVAGLIPDPNAEGPAAAHFTIPPDVKTGVFNPGSIYIFNLWPTTTRTR